jgi:hypothetical protein
MITYLLCRKCLRAFSAQVRDDKGTPQDHRNELLKSDLKRVEHGRDFVGCAFDECKGSLSDFAWWKDMRAEAKARGLNWPHQPISGYEYVLNE